MVTNDAGDDGGRGSAPAVRPSAALLALLAGTVVGAAAVVDGGVSGLARPGVVLGAAVLLGSLVAVPALLR